uniref:putative receptor-like protein kinase At5g39000 n=1 Tax=Erigeron canadensis TaxID=72917 RepID=UPI001CB8CAA7|nr:putative receptor-like protein kinase At5g39000 [Erigeron canadensis]
MTCIEIPLQDIISATNDFAEANVIGKGGFGKVYKGEIMLSMEPIIVAIKRLDSSYGQGPHEFEKEIKFLSSYKHSNLVSLLGFCVENGESILVYEYLSNRSLDLHISRPDISWLQRIKICLEAAKGLQFLHEPVEGSSERLLHRDIKSANILLDQYLNPKIADFGLSKLAPAGLDCTLLQCTVVGTVGYSDPMYMREGFLTKASDIYSFGVVLFEVMCGRPQVTKTDDGELQFLTPLSLKRYEQNKMGSIIIGLDVDISPKCLNSISKIAYRCLHLQRERRPSIQEIVHQLAIAYKYQQQFENPELLIEEPLNEDTIETETETVRVKFQLQRKCSYEDKILVTGNDQVLGLWDPNNAIELKWSEDHLWSTDLDIPTAKFIKFKFIMRKGNGEIVWQPGPDRVLACYKTDKTMTLSEDWEDPDSRWITEFGATLNQPLVSVSGAKEP